MCTATKVSCAWRIFYRTAVQLGLHDVIKSPRKDHAGTETNFLGDSCPCVEWFNTGDCRMSNQNQNPGQQNQSPGQKPGQQQGGGQKPGQQQQDPNRQGGHQQGGQQQGGQRQGER
jgi:type VI secretion system secreted protein VgrG